ncbi:MAG: ABC transporter permease [Gammaproteobacteria bacterium]|nr:ABC transporter permease [Gammaproteobacteria bacterium]
MFFLLISICDSIQWNVNTNMTLLDKILSPIHRVLEFSYSKPCSLVSLMPKVIKVQDQYFHTQEHLLYVPNNWKTSQDVLLWGLKCILMTLSMVFILMLSFWRLYPKWSRSVKILSITILGILTLSSFCYLLSRHLHIFGTGQIGQDIFYQAMKSIRTGLFISLLTSITMLPFAVGFGLLSGFYGGIIDDCIQFTYTVISSIPSVLLIGASLLSWQFFVEHYYFYWTMMQQADARLLMICLLLGLTNWATLCRVIRAEVLKLREMNYIKAAKLFRTPSLVILKNHLLPNIMHIIIISVVLDFSYLVLAESLLTYIGIGVSPMTISWGNMINAARLELARIPVVWWPLVTAFSFMFILVLVCNLLADSIRKALNPRENDYQEQR